MSTTLHSPARTKSTGPQLAAVSTYLAIINCDMQIQSSKYHLLRSVPPQCHLMRVCGLPSRSWRTLGHTIINWLWKTSDNAPLLLPQQHHPGKLPQVAAFSSDGPLSAESTLWCVLDPAFSSIYGGDITWAAFRARGLEWIH